MASPVRSGLVHYRGECWTCGAFWEARNVMGIAAKHADRYPDHNIGIELGYSFRWGPEAREDVAKRLQKARETA